MDSEHKSRPIIIQKYGGSSVATLEKLDSVARSVVRKHSEGYGVVVVVSAMGNRTDELIKLASQITSTPPARELDMLLSTGERVTMALLSIAIQKHGAESISFTGSQSGIITNDSHSHARIIQVRPYRIQDELERGRIVIVAGFQGTSYKNEITTLGRGGSDMTAIALAGALSAEACEIYSDVDGVYTADPKVVLDARKLDELSSAEMLEMAQHGAKVLHDEAILYAHRHQIALYAKRSHDASSTGSYIRPDGWPQRALDDAENRPMAVVSAKKVMWVSCDVQSKCGISGMQWLDSVCGLDGVKVLDMSMDVSDGKCHVQAILDIWNCSGGAVAGICDSIANLDGDVRTDVRNVTVVGLDLGRMPEFVRKMWKALDDGKIDVVSVFSQPNAVSFVVPEQEVAEASRILHGFVR